MNDNDNDNNTVIVNGMTYEERMKLLYPEFWQAVVNGRKGAIDMSHLTPEEFVEAITNIKR
jgi:hypothetical protein